MRRLFNAIREFLLAAFGVGVSYVLSTLYLLHNEQLEDGMIILVIYLVTILYGMSLALFPFIYALWLKFRFRHWWQAPASPSFLIALTAGLAYPWLVVGYTELCNQWGSDVFGYVFYPSLVLMPLALAEGAYRLIRKLQER